MSYRSALLRITIDILCPSVDDIYKVKGVLKTHSVINHNVILQTTVSPAIISFKIDDSLNLLKQLQQEDWEKVLKQRPLLLR